jgi:hypothetical protein
VTAGISSRVGWLARAIAVVATLLLAYALTLDAWLAGRVQRAQTELDTSGALLREAETAARRLPQFDEEFLRLERQLEGQALALPDATVAWLPADLSRRADQYDVELTGLSRRSDPTTPTDPFFGATPLRVGARGGLPALGDLAAALWEDPSLRLDAIQLERDSERDYVARIDLVAYERLSAGSALPTCERTERALFGASHLVAMATPLESREESGEGWRQRRATYRIERLFKLTPVGGVLRPPLPAVGETLLVARGCLTRPDPPPPETWPTRAEYCADSEPGLPASDAPPAGRVGPAQTLLVLQRRTGGVWEPTSRRGLLGLCDAPLFPEHQAGYAEMRTGVRDGA